MPSQNSYFHQSADQVSGGSFLPPITNFTLGVDRQVRLDGSQSSVHPIVAKITDTDSKVNFDVEGEQISGGFVVYSISGALIANVYDHPVADLIKPGWLTASQFYIGFRQHPELYSIFRFIGHGGTLKDITIYRLSGTGANSDEVKSVITTTIILKEAKLTAIDFVTSAHVAGVSVVYNQIEVESAAIDQANGNKKGVQQKTIFDLEAPHNKKQS